MKRCITLVALLTLCAAIHAAPTRVLILSGLNNHDWKSTTPVLKKTLAATDRFTVDVTEKPETLAPDALAAYDVIVSNWNSWSKKGVEKAWSPELRKAYLDFVRNGKGHVVIHAGSSSFYDWPDMQKVYGANWKLGATGHGPCHEFPVRATATKHPITEGVREFRVTDELWNRPGLQSGVVVLAESFSASEKKGTGNWEPCLTVNPFGKGRSVTLLLGHDVRAMENPGFRTLLTRATEWAATGKVTLEPMGNTGSSADTDRLLEAIKGYAVGQSRKTLFEVEQLVTRTTNRDVRAGLASKMAAMLADKTVTLDAKRFLCRQLRLAGTAKDVPALKALLSDSPLATEARFALEGIPAPEAADAMRDALETAKGRTRVGLINSLGVRRDTKSVPLLIPLIASADSEVATAGLIALSRIGTPETAEALLACHDRVSQELAATRSCALLQAAESLTAAGANELAATIFAELLSTRHPAHVRTAAFTGRIATGGPEAERSLRDALAGDDPRLQAAAIKGARHLGGDTITRALAESLPSVTPDLQLQIVSTLGSRGDPAALPSLLRVVADGASALRVPAAIALSQIGGKVVVTPLVDMTVNAKGNEQSQLRGALVALRGEEIDTTMVSLLATAESDAACELIMAIEARGTTQATPILLKLTAHESSRVRRAAIAALGTLSDLSAVPPLIDALDTAGASERRSLERALRNIAGRAPSAEEASKRLIEQLEGASLERRASVLAVLGGLGTSGGRRVIEAALEDTDDSVRRAAVKALAEWPDASPLPQLLALAESRKQAPEGILALRGVASMLARDNAMGSDERLALLKKAFSLTDNPDELRGLIAAAGTVGHRGALDLIVPCLANPAVATEAALAATAIFGALPSKALGPNLALGAKASSPDGLEKDGHANGDQAGIDGNPNTYWDEANDKGLYRFAVTFPKPTTVSAIRMIAWEYHSFSAKDFDIVCDGKVVRSIRNAAYNGRNLVVVFPSTTCTTLQLEITGYYPQSPAIRELEIYGL